jgi:hypothetical protein
VEGYIDHLNRNGGRRSAELETAIAALTRKLIDRYAAGFIKDYGHFP